MSKIKHPFNKRNDFSTDENDNIYTPKKLNDILFKKIKVITRDFKNISMIGDIKIARVGGWGINFKLSDNNTTFTCIVWTNDNLNINDIKLNDNKRCKITGDIEPGKFDRFQLRVKKIDVMSDESKINQLKQECENKGYFLNKKTISWNQIQKIGIISKKKTQGYNDFMKQFNIPIEIKLETIALEGSNTSKQSIEAINKLQNVDIIIFIRGGGSTTDISNSYDKMELYDAIKRSRIPVITAIGHENDKEDKLLITRISDLDYSTPSTASYEMRKIILEPIKNKLTKLLDEIKYNFEKKYKKDIDKEYNNLEYLLNQFIKEIFGGPIVKITEKDKYIIIQKGDKFYKNEINFNETINHLTKKELEYKQNIINGLNYSDINLIQENFNKFNIDNNELHENIKDSIKQVNSLEKIKNKFDNITPKKLKKMYCKEIPKIPTKKMKKLCNLKRIILWYRKMLDELTDKNEKEFKFLKNII